MFLIVSCECLISNGNICNRRPPGRDVSSNAKRQAVFSRVRAGDISIVCVHDYLRTPEGKGIVPSADDDVVSQFRQTRNEIRTHALLDSNAFAVQDTPSWCVCGGLRILTVLQGAH